MKRLIAIGQMVADLVLDALTIPAIIAAAAGVYFLIVQWELTPIQFAGLGLLLLIGLVVDC